MFKVRVKFLLIITNILMTRWTTETDTFITLKVNKKTSIGESTTKAIHTFQKSYDELSTGSFIVLWTTGDESLWVDN